MNELKEKSSEGCGLQKELTDKIMDMSIKEKKIYCHRQSMK